METLFARWASAVNCSTVTIHDPYLCTLLRGHDFFAAAEALEPALLEDAAAAVGLQHGTAIGYVRDLAETINSHAPQLRRIRVVTRGLLRHDAPAGRALQEWTDEANAHWNPRGVQVAVEVDPRCHLRRVSMEGLLSTVEVCLEFGLAVHVDSAANWALAPAARRVRRAEVQVFLHRRPRLDSEGATGQDRLLAVPTFHQWNGGMQHYLRDDLLIFGRRHRLAASLHLEAEPAVSVPAHASAAVLTELSQILRWYEDQHRLPAAKEAVTTMQRRRGGSPSRGRSHRGTTAPTAAAPLPARGARPLAATTMAPSTYVPPPATVARDPQHICDCG